VEERAGQGRAERTGQSTTQGREGRVLTSCSAAGCPCGSQTPSRSRPAPAPTSPSPPPQCTAPASPSVATREKETKNPSGTASLSDRAAHPSPSAEMVTPSFLAGREKRKGRTEGQHRYPTGDLLRCRQSSTSGFTAPCPSCCPVTEKKQAPRAVTRVYEGPRCRRGAWRPCTRTCRSASRLITAAPSARTGGPEQ